MTEQLFAMSEGVHVPVSGSAVLSANRKGEIAETLFIAGAMVHDWEVFTPFGHAQTTDVCIMRPGTKALKVQVKTARRRTDADGYGICSHRERSGVKRAYTSGDFDVLAGYLPDVNQFVFWSFEDIAGRVKINYSPIRHRAPGNWQLLDELSESPTNLTP